MTTTTQKNRTENTETSTHEDVRRWEEALSNLDERIDVMERQVKKAEHTAREKAQTIIAGMRSKRDELSRQLEDVQARGSDAWSEIQDGFERGWNELEEAFTNAGNVISKS